MNPILAELKALKDEKQAINLAKFFKSGKGQYGEGDQFLGIKVPLTRQIVNKYYKDCDLVTVEELLHNEFHEARLAALLILVKKFAKEKDSAIRKSYYDFYLSHSKNINNWDLVDLSARDIVGEYLLDKDRSVLLKLAKSNNLWEKRIAIISTYCFIKKSDFILTLQICDILISDKHDLIHKAVGWMLREIGNRDKSVLVDYLNLNKSKLPRTALRYAIEHLSPQEREFYMQK